MVAPFVARPLTPLFLMAGESSGSIPDDATNRFDSLPGLAIPASYFLAP
ncbi:MAG: hypothetical protein QOE55_2838 [Acidobacteriaceae bacterium]|jgi:hypothetical protein|nr:hypothetical protein [Acidobacteriaceae bacterium]